MIAGLQAFLADPAAIWVVIVSGALILLSCIIHLWCLLSALHKSPPAASCRDAESAMREIN